MALVCKTCAAPHHLIKEGKKRKKRGRERERARSRNGKRAVPAKVASHLLRRLRAERSRARSRGESLQSKVDRRNDSTRDSAPDVAERARPTVSANPSFSLLLCPGRKYLIGNRTEEQRGESKNQMRRQAVTRASRSSRLWAPDGSPTSHH